jgi:hypothetical protein
MYQHMKLSHLKELIKQAIQEQRLRRPRPSRTPQTRQDEVQECSCRCSCGLVTVWPCKADCKCCTSACINKCGAGTDSIPGLSVNPGGASQMFVVNEDLLNQINEIKAVSGDSHGCCDAGFECQSFSDCPLGMGCSASPACPETGCCKRTVGGQALQNR